MAGDCNNSASNSKAVNSELEINLQNMSRGYQNMKIICLKKDERIKKLRCAMRKRLQQINLLKKDSARVKHVRLKYKIHRKKIYKFVQEWHKKTDLLNTENYELKEKLKKHQKENKQKIDALNKRCKDFQNQCVEKTRAYEQRNEAFIKVENELNNLQLKFVEKQTDNEICNEKLELDMRAAQKKFENTLKKTQKELENKEQCIQQYVKYAKEKEQEKKQMILQKDIDKRIFHENFQKLQKDLQIKDTNIKQYIKYQEEMEREKTQMNINIKTLEEKVKKLQKKLEKKECYIQKKIKHKENIESEKKQTNKKGKAYPEILKIVREKLRMVSAPLDYAEHISKNKRQLNRSSAETAIKYLEPMSEKRRKSNDTLKQLRNPSPPPCINGSNEEIVTIRID